MPSVSASSSAHVVNARRRNGRGNRGDTRCSSRITAIGIRNGPNTLGSLNRPLARSPLSTVPRMNERPGIGTFNASTETTAEIAPTPSHVMTTVRERDGEST